MRKVHSFLLLAAIILSVATLTSCQRELHFDDAGSDTNTEVGAWKFISIHGSLSQTTEYTEGSNALKLVTTGEYTTENNDGTIQFDSSVMTANGVRFAINTTVKNSTYVNGTLAGSASGPLSMTIPPQNNSAGYRKISADSLYFPSGGLIDLGSGGILPVIPTGCTLQFDGNTMLMTVVYDQVGTETNQGITQKITNHAEMVITLQKL